MRFPATVQDLSTDVLTAAVQERYPDVEVRDFDVLEIHQCGDGLASTADRVILGLHYGGEVPDELPARVVLKTMLVSPHAPQVLYENEVRFYREIRPVLDIETPRVLASHFDPESGQFGVIMEDLKVRGARFPRATDPVTVDEVKGVLRTLARLHGAFWRSERLEGDLSWVATPLAGGVSDFLQGSGFDLVKEQVDSQRFKQELIAPLGLSLEDMWDRLRRFQRECEERQPQTLLHGDPHIANTYLLPDSDGGLFDWQLMVRGCWGHDVSYLIVTALTPEQRRQHQQELLDWYLDNLAAQGVTDVPSRDEAWSLYRRYVMWGLFIGWLITPPENYGMEVTVANIEKLVSAARDLDSFA